jgi:hypothetical protein
MEPPAVVTVKVWSACQVIAMSPDISNVEAARR